MLHFVDVLVGVLDGGLGDEARDLAVGEFAENTGLAEVGAVAADGSVGVGEVAVVQDVGLLEAGEYVVDIGGVFGAAGKFFTEFADRKSTAAEQAGGVVPESGIVKFGADPLGHDTIVATICRAGNI